MRLDLFEKYDHDPDLPRRVWWLGNLARVLDGSLYDCLSVPFHQESSDNKGMEYIPVRQRRPSVRYALCNCIVDDSVSLVFSEAHFPQIQCADLAVAAALRRIIGEARLNSVLIEAATRGSIGSVALQLLLTRSRRAHVKVLSTQYLTPCWDPEEPDELLKVTERYKVKGSVLRDAGYTMPIEDGADYWFQRDWDRQAETWFVPWLVTDRAHRPVVDRTPGRTTEHGLGFVPIVWIRNLPGGDEIDGACTFRDAIEIGIEIDYQLSQLGRGLRYSQDPLLMIKEPTGNSGAPFVRSASNAIRVDAEGDAKLLEIDGTASGAVLDYVRMLRELALEAVHGNRANADRISAAQSGRALELLYQALIWLADRLRLSYGTGGLLPLLRMIVRASQRFPLTIGGQDGIVLPAASEISLKWPPYIEPSEQDSLASAQALGVLLDRRLIARRTAMLHVAGLLDIEDIDAERALIARDQAEAERQPEDLS